MSFTGITGAENAPGLECDEGYMVKWDITVKDQILWGSMYVYRKPGNKLIPVDVVYIEEGLHLDLYCMNENSSLSDALSIGECSDKELQVCIDDFVKQCEPADHLFLVIFNRGTEMPQLSTEPDWFSYPSFNDSEDRFLNVVEENGIPPGLCGIVDLGPLSELGGQASLSFADGSSLDLTWEEVPGGNETPEDTSSSGGCALSLISRESLLIFLALFLVFVWKP